MTTLSPKAYATIDFLAYVISTDESGAKLKQLYSQMEHMEYFGLDGEYKARVEMMENSILRFHLEGRRCGLRFCYSITEGKIIRQPNGLQPLEGWKAADICPRNENRVQSRELIAAVEKRIEMRKAAEEEIEEAPASEEPTSEEETEEAPSSEEITEEADTEDTEMFGMSEHLKKWKGFGKKIHEQMKTYARYYYQAKICGNEVNAQLIWVQAQAFLVGVRLAVLIDEDEVFDDYIGRLRDVKCMYSRESITIAT